MKATSEDEAFINAQPPGSDFDWPGCVWTYAKRMRILGKKNRLAENASYPNRIRLQSIFLLKKSAIQAARVQKSRNPAIPCHFL